MMNVADKRMLEREALRNMIQQWNANRIDLFELSEPNENLEFHGVMRFYFQDSGQKIATKCIRVASDATVSDVIETLIEKFRPDMRMLSLPSYALYEVHATHEERRLSPNEKPLLVQLNWHADDREGRFLLKCVDQNEQPINNNASDTSNQNFKRKLSKREKKELKKKEKLSRMKSDATNDENKPVAEKLYTELPETSFTRSISNPEAVMRRRRQQKLERKLQQFRSKDGGPDTGGTLKIYGESLCPDVPYKTLLLSVGDCAAHVVREMLEKYGLGKNDPQQFCLMQVNAEDNSEYVLDDDECPLAIVMTHPHRGSIMFHVRRRPADCQPRRRKKKSSVGGNGGSGGGSVVGGSAAAIHHPHHHHRQDTPFIIEVTPDGTPIEKARRLMLANDVIEVGSGNGMALQLYGPSIQPRHCVVAPGGVDGVATVTPLHADAELYVNGQKVYHTAILQHGCLIKFGRVSTFRFVDPMQESKLNRNLSQSQHFDSGSIYDRSPTSPIPDNSSGVMSPAHNQFDGMHSPTEGGIANSTANVDYQRAMSPMSNSQDNFNFGSKSHIDLTDSLSPYNNNNNNNNLKMDTDSLILSQHFTNSKSDLLQDNHFASPYIEHDQLSKSVSGQLKDNYETTFDLDGNVETKSICSAKSGGSGHETTRSQQLPARGQEAILPAVLEFPEAGQQQFLHAVISRLDVHVPAFKLAPVYTLYLCARYRASTHYRPELSPTERAHKLTALLHHIASLIQSTIQERYSEAAAQAFWMANGSELLHFLKCDRHISAFSVQAQDVLAIAVQSAFTNLIQCFQAELSLCMQQFLSDDGFEAEDGGPGGPVLGVLAGAMALLRRCRVNAALTIQLFSHLFHYINAYCYNKIVTTPSMCTSRWGLTTAARLSQLASWAEVQGLELAADCHLARLQQVAHLLQAPKNTPDDIAAITSTCFKLNSIQLRQLLGNFVHENGSAVRPELVELAVQHAMSVADELYKSDGREIILEESLDLGVQLLVPGDGYSGDVVRGVPPALQDFIAPLQRARLCRLTLQPHSRGAWTVYMNGYHGGSISMKPTSQQPVVQVIQLHKNSNGMGLSIVAAKGAGQSRLGIYIKSVVSGGAAAADGRLQAGDQLLSVDGHSLQGITQEKAAEYLVRTGPVVTLEVAKQGAVLHGLATLLQQPSPQTNRGPRRASERDLPSRLESEHGAMQVKPSKSVPTLHEQTRQHDVFNPGYSRTSSNNSIPTMAGLKSRSSHNLSAPLSPGVQPNVHPHAHHHHNQQNQGLEQGFYQNVSTYKNPASMMQQQQQQLGDRFSNLRSSQNGLQLHGLQNVPQKQSPMQASPNMVHSDMRPGLNQQHSNTLGPQRPQSAYYGNQQMQTSLMSQSNGLRSAQSSKDLPGSYDVQSQQMRGNYPSMPNVNQSYAQNGPMYLNQAQNQYSNTAPNQGNINYTRPPQQASQSSFRGQAKLAEMSEEVTRRQQRGPMSAGEAQNSHTNRFHYNSDSYNNRTSNGPLSPSALQNSPTKQQPPVAPKPPGMKRVVSGDLGTLEGDGPPLPPPTTHPQFQTDEDGSYLASALDPPALSVYPAHHSHPHPSQQQRQPATGGAPNPWQREEREKEAMARRAAARARRDAALAALVALGNSRSPLQTQQLRALQLERDFERRAATEMSDNNDDKEIQDSHLPLSPQNGGGGLLRLVNSHQAGPGQNPSLQSMSTLQHMEATAGMSLVPVSSNVVSSIQPVSIVTSNVNGGEQQMDSPAGQQTPVPNYPPPPPPTQPKSILKSNLRLENLNTNTPQSPSKAQKNASFSSNLTPQSLKLDQTPTGKYEQAPLPSKYDQNKFDQSKFEQNLLSKYDPGVPKFSEQQTPVSSKYEQNSFNAAAMQQNMSKYDPNISVGRMVQNMSNLNVSSHERYDREVEIAPNAQMRFEDHLQGYDAGSNYDGQPNLPPPPPERGSSFAVMSQAQQLRSNVSASSQLGVANPNLSGSLRDKRVSFHDKDQNQQLVDELSTNDLNMEIIREDPDRFIAEAENMLQSPSTPTSTGATHTPGVIGAQEVYRDPRTRRLLAEQQQKQQQNTPIPEKLSFKEKMKMFALESGENNTPKDKVKISRAQRDIDAVH